MTDLVCVHHGSELGEGDCSIADRSNCFFRERAKECDCCWVVGCLCPMPSNLNKVIDGFTNLVNLNVGQLNGWLRREDKQADYQRIYNQMK